MTEPASSTPAGGWPLGVRLAALAVVLAVTLVAAIRLGAVPLSTGEVLGAIAGRGTPMHATIVRELRLPRALQAALVGAALAVSGATFQALLRNPLAEPYVLGISSGASVGAVIAVVTGLSATTIWALPTFAFAGAILSMLLVLRIALGVGRALDTRVLLLAGVVVSSFLVAVIWLILTFADIEAVRSAIFWMMGSHAGATWRSVAMSGACLVPALVVLLALGRPLNLLAIGEPTAAYLGTSVERTKRLAFGTATLLTAASVSVSGSIGFVGLVVPHVVRMLWGNDNRALIPCAALLGAAFLVGADTLAAHRGRRDRAADRRRHGVRRRAVLRLAAAAPGRGMTAAAWAVRDVRYRHDGAARPAVDGVSLDVPAGKLTALLGPNGAGKSTLLSLLLGTLRPAAGVATLRGRPVEGWSRGELARAVGVVPQGEQFTFPLTVRALVDMGRYPHLGPWQRARGADVAAVDAAMARCGVTEFADRAVSTLSGGERQRARLARALAQIMLDGERTAPDAALALDEPTAALDLAHEMSFFGLMRALADGGTTVLLVTHHLDLAARFADHLVLLHEGHVVADGTPAEVLSGDTVSRVYRWPVAISPYAGGGRAAGVPQVVPLDPTDRAPSTAPHTLSRR